MVELDRMSWTDLRDRVAAGATTVIVPIGGTEQSGPHMALGKHNVRVAELARRIARDLGNAIVAPVIAYVPEGEIDPPTAHMRFAGTISIPEAAFESMLEGAGRSLRQHGFKDIVFIGDHGGYQKNEQRVADRLNAQWKGHGQARAHALLDYYRVTQSDYVAALKSQGHSTKEIGTHAGLADTSLSMAIDAGLVQADRLAQAGRVGAAEGVYGDPTHATAQLGRAGVDMIVRTSVENIRRLTANPR